MTIQEILDQFLETQKNSQLCIAYATKIDTSKDEVSFLIKELIINSSFMNMVVAWEKFLERSVIAYTLSQKSLNGNSPKCFISPKNEEHANDLIRGTTQYFDWSKSEVVQSLTENIFENGSPYKSVLSGINSILLQIKNCAII